MTYSASDVAARRASPGIDVHAGHSPRPRGSREVLSGTLGIASFGIFGRYGHIAKLAAHA